MSDSLTPEELVFAQRMLPHFMAGKSPAEAAEAVIADDWRLLAAIIQDRGEVIHGDFSDAITFNYDMKPSATELRSRLSWHVYHRLRATPAREVRS